MEKVILKVSQKSNPKSVAGAIANNVRENKDVEIVAMGAGAVNQAIKAIAISSGYLKPDNIKILTEIKFTHLKVGEEERSALQFNIITKKLKI